MYLFAKALHLISMVAWFAGLFYMFRLFVYHVENANSPDSVKMLKIMEHKLYNYITTPAMVSTIFFGILLTYQVPDFIGQFWFQLKLMLLIVLVIYHFYISYTLKRFKRDDLFLSSKQCRMLNEAPTLLLVGIILCAVYKYTL